MAEAGRETVVLFILLVVSDVPLSFFALSFCQSRIPFSHIFALNLFMFIYFFLFSLWKLSSSGVIYISFPFSVLFFSLLSAKFFRRIHNFYGFTNASVYGVAERGGGLLPRVPGRRRVRGKPGSARTARTPFLLRLINRHSPW